MPGGLTQCGVAGGGCAQGRLPLLRFQEYKLLRRKGEAIIEDKSGATLFNIVPETKRRRDAAAAQAEAVKRQAAELQLLKRQKVEIETQLDLARQTMLRQQAEINELKGQLASPALLELAAGSGHPGEHSGTSNESVST